MPNDSAEQVYLFRHALTRDAAYQMQLPIHRAARHRSALEVLDGLSEDPGPYSLSKARHARAAIKGSETQTNPGLHRRELALLHLAASFAESEFDNASAARLHDECAAHPCADPAARCLALNAAGRVYLLLGLPDEADDRLKRALELATNGAHSPSLESTTLCALGLAAQQTGRLTEAGALLERALAGFIRLGDRAMTATVLHNLSSLNPRGQRHALELSEQALEIVRELRDRKREGTVMGNMAVIWRSRGDYTRAEELYRTAISIHREVGDRRFEGITLANLGTLLLGRGDAEAAQRALLRALEILREVGDRRSQGHVLGNLPLLYKRAGRLSAAEQGFRDAISLLREVGERRLEAFALGNLATLLHETGRIADAEQRFILCRELLCTAGDMTARAVFGCQLGFLHLLKGELKAAVQLATEAESAIGDGQYQIEYLLQLQVRIAAANGDVGTARIHAGDMQARLVALGLGPGTDCHNAYEKCRRLVESATSFRGHLLSELSPQLRQALAQRMSGSGEELPTGLLVGPDSSQPG